MKYIDETHTFIIYSENEALIGSRAITLSAHLTDYPEVKSSQAVTTTIDIVEVPETCESVQISIGSQNEVEDYLYTG